MSEILSCLQANKLPNHSLTDASRSQETLLLVINTLSLKTQQVALASCSHRFRLSNTMGIMPRLMGRQAQMVCCTHSGSLFQVSNCKLRKASIYKGAASISALPQRETLTLLFWSYNRPSLCPVEGVITSVFYSSLLHNHPCKDSMG